MGLLVVVVVVGERVPASISKTTEPGVCEVSTVSQELRSV